jgi:hypothetical protein
LVDGPYYIGGINGEAFNLATFGESKIYDSNLSNAWTNEYILGIEREITNDFSLGAIFNTFRYGNSFAFCRTE